LKAFDADTAGRLRVGLEGRVRQRRLDHDLVLLRQGKVDDHAEDRGEVE
jgi:hypothetical protein